MFNKLEYISLILVLLIPLTLITGPAVPDISITLISIFFLYYIFVNKKIIISEKWIVTILVFWLILLFCSFFAKNNYIAFSESFIFIRILLIPIFLYVWILNTNKRINYVLGFIFIAVIFVAIDCLYQFINYEPEIGFGKDLLGFTSTFYGRLSGPFKDLVPGSYIAKFGFLGLCFIFINLKNKNKLLFFSAILYLTICGIITYISGERMAFATLFLGIVLGIILYSKYRLIFFLSLILIFFSIYIINKTHPIYNDYKIIESTPYHLGQKIEKKYRCGQQDCIKIINLQPELKEVLKNFKASPYGNVYLLALKMYSDNKLFGIGLNNFNYLCKKNNNYKPVNNCWSHPHNFYLQWLVESGLVGFFGFIIFLLTILYKIYLNKQNYYAPITFIVFAILFWPIMSTGSLLKNWHGIETFFILGVALSLLNYKKNTNLSS